MHVCERWRDRVRWGGGRVRERAKEMEDRENAEGGEKLHIISERHGAPESAGAWLGGV